MFYLTLILAILGTLLIIVFATQNSTMVDVSLFTWNINTSLVLVIFGSAILGFFTAFFLQLYTQIKLRLKLHKAQNQIKELEKKMEVTNSMHKAETNDSTESVSP